MLPFPIDRHERSPPSILAKCPSPNPTPVASPLFYAFLFANFDPRLPNSLMSLPDFRHSVMTVLLSVFQLRRLRRRIVSGLELGQTLIPTLAVCSINAHFCRSWSLASGAQSMRLRRYSTPLGRGGWTWIGIDETEQGVLTLEKKAGDRNSSLLSNEYDRPFRVIHFESEKSLSTLIPELWLRSLVG